MLTPRLKCSLRVYYLTLRVCWSNVKFLSLSNLLNFSASYATTFDRCSDVLSSFFPLEKRVPHFTTFFLGRYTSVRRIPVMNIFDVTFVSKKNTSPPFSLSPCRVSELKARNREISSCSACIATTNELEGSTKILIRRTGSFQGYALAARARTYRRENHSDPSR